MGGHCIQFGPFLFNLGNTVRYSLLIDVLMSVCAVKFLFNE